MSTFIHQVEMKLPEAGAPERLRRIESWCADWEIGFHVLDRMPGSENLRFAFEEKRLARAFVAHFGGVMVPADEFEAAMAVDASEDSLYDQLAAEYPD
ncbi:MAG: hypothetical protein EOO23_01970 [Comamonadaceae bacterium]|nr:MAG: hypothetical protein EOO23_01970 [Comamonadaceae bacterium]